MLQVPTMRIARTATPASMPGTGGWSGGAG